MTIDHHRNPFMTCGLIILQRRKSNVYTQHTVSPAGSVSAQGSDSPSESFCWWFLSQVQLLPGLLPDRSSWWGGCIGAGEQSSLRLESLPPHPALSRARVCLFQPHTPGLSGTQGAVETSLMGRKEVGCAEEQIPT